MTPQRPQIQPGVHQFEFAVNVETTKLATSQQRTVRYTLSDTEDDPGTVFTYSIVPHRPQTQLSMCQVVLAANVEVMYSNLSELNS